MKKKSADVVLYKILMDGCPIWGGTLEYSLPTAAGPGDWHEVDGDIVRCRNGLHLTAAPGERWRDGAECYLVETEGPVLHEAGWGDEYVARKVRLVRRLSWAELAAFGIRANDDAPMPAPAKKSRSTQPKVAAGPSAAMTFVRWAWDHRCQATAHSWRTVSSTMHDALMLAITSGMSFAEGDFAEISRAMRGGYWMGETGESFYAAACKEGNLQACKSFEAWTARKPFMWEGKRLHVGRPFAWDGLTVKVTSFQDERGALVACSYERDVTRRGYDGKIARRFTITREALARAEKERKAEGNVHQDALTLAKALSKCGLTLDVVTLMSWTQEERESAGEWAALARHDAGKKRVALPEAPAHLGEAIAHEAERERQRQIVAYQGSIKDGEREVDYGTQRIAYAREALAKLRAEETAQAEAA